MKNLILIMIISLVNLTGCSTLINTVKNDPTFTQPNGKRVAVKILGQSGELLNEQIEGKIILQEVAEWLRSTCSISHCLCLRNGHIDSSSMQ